MAKDAILQWQHLVPLVAANQSNPKEGVFWEKVDWADKQAGAWEWAYNEERWACNNKLKSLKERGGGKRAPESSIDSPGLPQREEGMAGAAAKRASIVTRKQCPSI